MEFYTDCIIRNNKILLRGYDNDRRFNQVIENYKPYLFMKDQNGNYETIYNEKLRKIQFDSIGKAKNFIYENKDNGNMKMFGLSKFEYLYLYDNYIKNGIKYKASLIRVLYLDIETTSNDGIPKIKDPYDEVTAITVAVNDQYITFGCKYYKSKSEEHEYILCNNEEDLLKKFIKFWSNDHPDIVTGWFSDIFDIPYLIARIKRVLGIKYANQLSPWNKLETKTIQNNGKDIEVEYPLGIHFLDYMRLYKKFRLILREKYTLNHICYIELKEKKLDYSEIGTIHNLHEKDFELFVKYNLQDVRLVRKLEQKFGYIDLAIAIAFLTGCSFTDSFGTVIPWDCFIHQKLMSKNIVIPFAQIDNESDSEIIGGYVKDPQIAKHKWLVSTDFDGLYPHIIMLCNIGPDTFVQKVSKKSIDNNIKDMINGQAPYFDEYCITANQCLYKKDKQSFFSELMEELYTNRKTTKKEMIEAKKKFEETKEAKYNDIAIQKNSFQYALKILGNGGYGAMINKWFRYYCADDGEAVTSTGQAAIQFTEKRINAHLNTVLKTTNIDYVVASDTDSLYIKLDSLVSLIFKDKDDKPKIVEFLAKFIDTEIQPIINQACKDFSDRVNAFKPKLNMKREKICSSGLWTAKKKYILDVWDDEGVRFHEPEIKVSGLEVVRASTPEICRDKLKKAYEIILRNDEDTLHKLVDEFKKIFFSASVVDISFPRGLNEYDKWCNTETICNKGTPIHVRGAIFYNLLLKEHNLENKYQPLSNNDKIKFIYLKEPNPIGTYVISYRDIIPPEFELDKYIDKSLQFQKTFLQPLQNVLSVVGWSYEKKASLTNFFTPD